MDKILWKITLFMCCVRMDVKNAMLRYRIWRTRRRTARLQNELKTMLCEGNE